MWWTWSSCITSFIVNISIYFLYERNILWIVHDDRLYAYDLLYFVWSWRWSMMLMICYDLLYAYDLVWSTICLCSDMICYMLMFCYYLLYVYVLHDLGVYDAYDLWVSWISCQATMTAAIGTNSDGHADVTWPSLLIDTLAMGRWCHKACRW
jgi:hypothetical protein